MFLSKIHEQTILEFSQGENISATADSFLIDRQARELSRHTIKFYLFLKSEAVRAVWELQGKTLFGLRLRRI